MSRTRSTLGEYYAEHGFTAFGVVFLGMTGVAIVAELSTALVVTTAVAGAASIATGLGGGNSVWRFYLVLGVVALALAGWSALGSSTTTRLLAIAGLGAAGGAFWRARQFYVATH